MKVSELDISWDAYKSLIDAECYEFNDSADIDEFYLDEVLCVDENYTQEILLAIKNYKQRKIDEENSMDEKIPFLESKGGYYYVDLQDIDAEIITEPQRGYFALLAELPHERRFFITYRSILDNPKRYLHNPIEKIIDTLNEREQTIINLRYGINREKALSLEEIGNQIGCSRETIRLEEEKALRKMSHPSRTSKIRNAWLGSKVLSENNSYYRSIAEQLEQLLNTDIKYLKNNPDAYYDDTIFQNIFTSPRFVDSQDYANTKSLEESGLSIRVLNCLKRAGVKTTKDLISLSDEELMNIGQRNAEEAKKVREDLKNKECKINTTRNIRHYELDVESIYNVDGELPITRTELRPKIMFNLLQRGFFYVSDFLDYYNEICSNEDRLEAIPQIMIDDSDALNILKHYSAPMVRVKIPFKIHSAMKARGITTYNMLVREKKSFPEKMKDEVEQLIGDIHFAAVIAKEEYGCRTWIDD